jgi:hypothetical protein
VTVYAGSSPTFGVSAIGPEPISYQWYLNGATLIPGATSPIYKLNNVQLSDSGKTFRCVVSNPHGSVNSTVATLNVIAAPVQAYPAAVLASQPKGFWRLGEPTDFNGNHGSVVFDNVGGFNGIYTNVILGYEGYKPSLDPNTAAQFGWFTTPNSLAGEINDITFASPTNTTSSFSVEAWVKGGVQSVNGAGIVAKGSGSGGEQFVIDCFGTASVSTPFRFIVRDASGTARTVQSSVQPDDNWHHIVGVCDQANGQVRLYVDSVLRGTTTIPTNGGILATTVPMSIGARKPDAASSYTTQFTGVIDDVAVYGTALSAAEIANHFFASQPAPVFAVQPIETTANEGTTVVFTSLAVGPGPINYQWYQNDSTPIGGNSTNLSLPGVTVAMSFSQYRVEATNPYGTTTTTNAILIVNSGPPQITTNIPAETVVYEGRSLVLAVSVAGTAPFVYQWKANGVNLINGGRVSGATSNVLVIANAQPGDAATYQLSIANGQGNIQSDSTVVTVSARPSFFTNGKGWTLNGTGAAINNNGITLSQGTGHTRSAFFGYPLYVGAFEASFIYSSQGGADGVAFVLQNDPRGAAALGGGGGGLGYSGITPSVAVELNIYDNDNQDPGVGFGVNGSVGAYGSAAPVSLTSGNQIQVDVVYMNNLLQATFTDLTTLSAFTTNYSVNIPSTVGASTAYVGVTGASGGISSTQYVTNFTYLPLPALSSVVTGPNALRLAWPTSIGGFVLESRASLSTGSWAPVGGAASVAGEEFQLTVPLTSDTRFYRLTLP